MAAETALVPQSPHAALHTSKRVDISLSRETQAGGLWGSEDRLGTSTEAPLPCPVPGLVCWGQRGAGLLRAPAHEPLCSACPSQSCPGGSGGKEPACDARDSGFIPGSGRPWRREWQPTPAFWRGDSHGQRSLAGYSPWGCKSRTRPSD